MKKRILMIEDTRSLVLAVGDRMRSLGYEFTSAHDGPTGLAKAQQESWDLLIVDLMLPSLAGDRIIRELRAVGSPVPILIVTAKDEVADRVAGLKAGADDYIVKPFSFEELSARVEAHLRRGPSSHHIEGNWLDTRQPDTSFGVFTLQYKTGKLLKNGKPVAIPHQEFRLLCLFAGHPNEVLEIDRILCEAWGYETLVPSRTVYVHVSWLRKKLRTDQRPDGYISTVRGLGYVFEP